MAAITMKCHTVSSKQETVRNSGVTEEGEDVGGNFCGKEQRPVSRKSG